MPLKSEDLNTVQPAAEIALRAAIDENAIDGKFDIRALIKNFPLTAF